MRLAAFNGRHPWDHNGHFHGWILRNLPGRRTRALDVGCGQGGLLLRLSGRFGEMDGVDADAEMAGAAAAATAGDPTITVRHGDFLDVEGQYDVITMVAVLHHLELDAALRHARVLLADGGRLLVVGLARQRSLADLGWDLVSAVLNAIVGLLKHPHPTSERPPWPFPVKPPTHDLDAIRAVVAHELPGARVRRRLFFRYTLAWTKPSSTSSA